MDKDDPEKRIAELERQLAERQRADADAAAKWESPPAYTPYPPPPDAGQAAPPRPTDWQDQTQAAPSSYSPPPYSPTSYSYSTAPSRNQGARIALILLFVGLPIVGLVIAGVAALSAFHHATRSLVPTPPGQFSVGSPPSAGGSQPPGSAGAATSLQTPDGLSGLLAQIRSKFGDTMGYELTVYGDYAVLDRADPQNSQHKKGYYFKGGSWSDFGQTEHVSSSDTLVDLGKFDAAAVAAKLAGAGPALNVPNPTSTYLIVEGQKGASTRIAVYASGNGDSGYMDINPDGSVLKLHPQT
jgi:hypothetical protein